LISEIKISAVIGVLNYLSPFSRARSSLHSKYPAGNFIRNLQTARISSQIESKSQFHGNNDGRLSPPRRIRPLHQLKHTQCNHWLLLLGFIHIFMLELLNELPKPFIAWMIIDFASATTNHIILANFFNVTLRWNGNVRVSHVKRFAVASARHSRVISLPWVIV